VVAELQLELQLPEKSQKSFRQNYECSCTQIPTDAKNDSSRIEERAQRRRAGLQKTAYKAAEKKLVRLKNDISYLN
jgi:hypothetical protein